MAHCENLEYKSSVELKDFLLSAPGLQCRVVLIEPIGELLARLGVLYPLDDGGIELNELTLRFAAIGMEKVLCELVE